MILEFLPPGMELRHLKYFVAVAETLNFTRAAQKLHMAQPPLTRQIRELEAEIGAELFVRDKRHVALTEAGRVLLKEANLLLAQFENALDSVRRASAGEIGTVHIGVALGLGETISPALREHAKHFPGIEISCRSIFSTGQNAALAARVIDVGFLRPPVDTLANQAEKIFSQPLHVLLHKLSPLAKRKAVRLRELADFPLLLHNRETSIGGYEKALELYQRAGITPRVVHTTTGPFEEAGALLVASGKGIYIGAGPAGRRPVLHKDVVAVALDEPEAKVDVFVAWRRQESSPAVLGFVETVRRVFGLPGKGSQL